MATHSSVLAWKIPGTEKPGGLAAVCRVAESDTTEVTEQQQQQQQQLLLLQPKGQGRSWHLIGRAFFSAQDDPMTKNRPKRQKL